MENFQAFFSVDIRDWILSCFIPLLISFVFAAGGIKVTICGCTQYANLMGTSIGYTIATAISMKWVSCSSPCINVLSFLVQ